MTEIPSGFTSQTGAGSRRARSDKPDTWGASPSHSGGARPFSFNPRMQDG
jgi:hypothetical protein